MTKNLKCEAMLFTALISVLIFSSSAVAKQKNVLFIAVDDLKPRLGCFGDDQVISPNIDQIAAAGTVFLNAHCQQAICGPSRVSLLTGYFPDRLGIYGMGPEAYKFRPKYPDMVTLPQHFKNNGYTTLGTGKIFDPRNLTGDWTGPQDEASWTTFFGRNPYNKQSGGPLVNGYYHDPALKVLVDELTKKGKAEGLTGKPLRFYVRDHGGGPAVESYDVPDDGYKDGAAANRGIEQLEKLKDSDKPFFLALGFRKPHLPFIAPKKYWDLYDREEMQLAPFQQYPAASPACAEIDFCEARTYSGVPAEGPIPEATQKELIHGYLACISYVDAQIGKVIAKLKQTGMYEDTVIILWGDHGFHLGDKQIWGKNTTYEQATQAPLIIANAGFPGGQSNASPVNLVDIFPTLCELTQLQAPTGIDGTSLIPILTDGDAAVHEYASTFCSQGDSWGIAIRTDRYRYVTWYEGRNKKPWQGIRLAEKPKFTELYDYESDPLEKQNLSNDPAYADTQRRLAELNRKHVEFTQSNQFKTKD